MRNALMTQMRLDKLLALQTGISRREAAVLVRQGAACLCGQPLYDPAQKVDPNHVTLQGKPIGYQKFVYLMMHKPAGVLTAAKDTKQQTVMDLVPPKLLRRGIQPVGRLDKDTTGLLLLTDNGMLAHQLLSPQHHVWKTYRARLSCPLPSGAEKQFAKGLELSDFVCLPAKLCLLEDGAAPLYEIQIREGKYHQVKRMFAAAGSHVTALCRTGFGKLCLPENLPEGSCRSLTAEEADLLLKASN
ncbi:MAG TPA: 16S rRNA pseudouridine(516) synthase [Ruminococcaceae bacterium]|jgi:16S rRNA pseudouridine516 synthase|nr:16S rRNA pseudouridine(516) synthase [Oscillospiraceae bacterium]HCM23177.1 16S rRNA pseudouridine(516) synthase [Oscillospiraceae bacterium]